MLLCEEMLPFRQNSHNLRNMSVSGESVQTSNFRTAGGNLIKTIENKFGQQEEVSGVNYDFNEGCDRLIQL